MESRCYHFCSPHRHNELTCKVSCALTQTEFFPFCANAARCAPEPPQLSLLSVQSHSPLLISYKLEEFPLAASWLGIGFGYAGYAGMRPEATDKQHER